jgi:hypothetical protein
MPPWYNLADVCCYQLFTSKMVAVVVAAVVAVVEVISKVKSML